MFRNQPTLKGYFFTWPFVFLIEAHKYTFKKNERLGECSKCGHLTLYENKYNFAHYSHQFGWFQLTAVCQTDDCECVNSEFKKLSLRHKSDET